MTRSYRRYTPEEDEFITKHLPKRGHAWVATRLHRSAGSVWARAKRLGVRFGDLPGWTRVYEVADAIGCTRSAIYDRAKRERALFRYGRPGATAKRSKAALVPNSWADAILEEHEDLRRGAELEAAGWITVPQAADLLGVGVSTVQRAVVDRRGLLAPLLLGVERARTRSGNHHPRWLLEPYGVKEAARELDSQRRLARRWVATKTIAVESGRANSTVTVMAVREYGGRLLFVRGGLSCFVPPAEAVAMRERLSGLRRAA